jgi:hypothetical protein
MVFGMGYSSCARGERLASYDAQGNRQIPFATVGGVELPVSWLDKAIEQQIGNNKELFANLPPEYKVGMYAQMVTSLVKQAQAYEFAKQQGVDVTDEAIKKQLGLGSEAEFRKMAKDELVKAGQLKPTDDDKAFDELVKKFTQGQTLSDIYKKQTEELTKILSDKASKNQYVIQFASRFAVEKIQKGLNPTDEDVKKSFETYEVKKILTMGDDKAKIEKAYADLKAGKGFEEIMEAVSDEPAQPNKKKADNMLNLSKNIIDKNPDYKVISTLQPGGFSEPVKVAEGWAIYKYAGKKGNIPADFEKQKEQYRNAFKQSEATRIFTEGVEKIEKTSVPSFDLKAYEALYLFGKAQMAPPGPSVTADYQKVVDAAKSVKETEAGYDLAVSAEVAAFQRIYDAPGSDKLKLKKDRIATLEKYLGVNPDSWTNRAEVITYYKDEKNGDKAYSLLSIALEKLIKYDTAAQQTYSDISAKFLELKAANLLKAEQETEFRKKQDQWLNAKASYEKTQEEFKKQEAESKKAAEAAKASDKKPEKK